MRNLTMKPMAFLLLFAGLHSLEAVAQTASPSGQQSQASKPSSGGDMPMMDHSKMGQETPVPAKDTKTKKKPASRKSTTPMKARSADQQGTAAAPQPAAQTAPLSGQAQKSPESSGMHDMSTMDHSKMGHAAPAPTMPASPQESAPGQTSTPAGGMNHAGHAGMSAAPAKSQQDAASKSPGGEHAGHVMQAPVAPAKPSATAAGTMPGMDHSAMGHAAGQAAAPSAQQGHASMGAAMGESMGGNGMTMGPMQGGKPPPDARDPNAYNEGVRHANFGNHEMNDNARFGKVLVDKAEAATGDGEHGQNVEAEVWYGNDYDKAWIKVDGERRGGTLESARTELLWDHAIATFWSSQVGVRHDGGEGGGRNWLALGVQGLAPYWFETEATAYLRSGGGLGARLNFKYEVLFTPRLILEPEVGANLYSRRDPEAGTGTGLSDVNAGLRLRYEITRKFAPYIGVTWNRQFGDTADFTRVRGGKRSQTQAVAGVRLWF